MTLKPGLYIVPTPIGNLGDITVRALETLKAVQCIYCEDTRVSQKLLSHFGIKAHLKVYNDHSSEKTRAYILEAAKIGPVALISDAGTPLIADPGYKLVRQAALENIYTTVLPGPCAAITGLALSGIPSDRFYFAGFFDAPKARELITLDATLVFYESPRRLLKTLAFFKDHMDNRFVSVCRELTKLYEESVFGSFDEVINVFSKRPSIKGEVVLVLSPPEKKDFSEDDLFDLFSKTPLQGKEAIQFISDTYKIPKKAVYATYLKFKE